MNLVMIMLTILSGTQTVENWSGFRGDGSSRTSVHNLPINWSDQDNLAWAVELTGVGQSSPVIWEDMVFVTSVDGKKKENLVVHALNHKTGKMLWEKTFPSSSPAPLNNYISKAAPTPVVDGNAVYAFFESGDLFALSHTGEVIWKRCFTKDYGEFQGNHGIGTSPAQSDKNLFFLISHSGPSYLISLDKATGKTVWKEDRESKTSWTSPLVIHEGGTDHLLVSSNGTAEEVSTENGERIWWVEGLNKNTVPSPSVDGEFFVVGSSQAGNCLAIRRDGKGNVTESHILWKAKKISSSFSSPLVVAGKVYFVNKAGIAFCNDLKTGESLWEKRLPSSCWTSSITDGKLIYFFCNGGETVVINIADEFNKKAENKLTVKGRVYGVAVADGTFVIRTESQLLCIRNKVQ